MVQVIEPNRLTKGGLGKKARTERAGHDEWGKAGNAGGKVEEKKSNAGGPQGKTTGITIDESGEKRRKTESGNKKGGYCWFDQEPKGGGGRESVVWGRKTEVTILKKKMGQNQNGGKKNSQRGHLTRIKKWGGRKNNLRVMGDG